MRRASRGGHGANGAQAGAGCLLELRAFAYLVGVAADWQSNRDTGCLALPAVISSACVDP